MTDSVSELITRIIDNFGSSALREINWICGVKDELQRIKETLISINAVLLDAQEQQSTSKSTRLWLRNLKFVAYDIEDVLDLISTQDLELRVNGRSLVRRITRLFTIYDVARELKVVRQKLDEIENNRRSFNFRERPNIPQLAGTALQRETHSHVSQKDVIGREEDKDRIVSFVMSSCSCDADCLSVIPIVGIGGMGKTTLAKLVFNDPRVIARFELRLWTHVSNKFVLKSLIVNILQSVTHLDFSNLNMELLQNKLCEKLGGRNFLLLLDDVWISDPKEWEELKALLAVGAPSSTIIVTTREERVATVTGTMEGYKLNSLSYDHCWSIFGKYAFGKGEEEAYPSLVQIGKSIVHKCRGVPLAAKTLGSALRHVRDDQAWKKIEESELWAIGQGPNDILPALKLSYDQIPYHMRSFFASSAVLKKGYSIFRLELINVWMALGLLPASEDGEIMGGRYFSELFSRSLFQIPSYAMAKEVIIRYSDVTDMKSPWKRLAQMFKKNLINDMDLVAQTYNGVDGNIVYLEMHDLLHDLATYVSDGEIAIVTSHKGAISEGARYILWDDEDLSINGFPVHLSPASKARLFSFVHRMGSISKSFLEGLLSNLKCLRVLNLDYSEFEELPDSVGNLKHLRYLSLCWNLKLTALPQSICKLVNLQFIYLLRCIRLKTFPKDIHKLVSLRFFEVTSKVSSFPGGGLAGLRSLRLLRFWYSPCLTSLPEEIGSLVNLRRFEITGCPNISTLPNEIKCLTNLETLKILYCQSLDLKDWEGLYGLRNLKYLVLSVLPKLIVLPEGFDSVVGSLQYFGIATCEGLRALPEGLQNCTSLLNISLTNCPNLTTLPRGIAAIKSLQQLNIDGCPELKRRCEKGTGSDWHLISHIPIIRIDHQVIHY